MTNFAELGLAAPLLKALAAQGFSTPTPIQEKAIPHVLAGRDLVGMAQTGTGKTAAFALPILHRLAANPARPPRNGARALILAPTRELVSQIAESFRAFGAGQGLAIATVFGGVPHGAQIRALARGLDILVAAPGRLVDHIEAGHADLRHTEILVLDEVDQMLDLGFIHPIRRVVRELSKRRQNLFFSATMPSDIRALAKEFLNEPVEVQVAPVATPAEKIEQKVILVEAKRKTEVLVDLLADPDMARTIVFTRTKRGADRVAARLEAAGINATAIHGNKSQGQRERALAAFRDGDSPVLVATDVAARGIDIDAVSHVVNFELPDVAERYVHRIGRTARAGASGKAVTLCDGSERAMLQAIEKLIRIRIPAEDRREAGGTAVLSDAVDGAPAKAQPRPRHAANHNQPNRARNGQQQRPAKSGGQRPAGQGAAKPAAGTQPKRKKAPRPNGAAGGSAKPAASSGESLAGVGFLTRSRRAG